MPKTAKGRKIYNNMQRTYGSKKGEEVFYASRNAGRIKGVDAAADPPEDIGGTGAESWVGNRRTGYRINAGDGRSLVSKGTFRRTIGDALRKGIPISDALGRGIAAATNTHDAVMARRGTFARHVRDGALKGGMTAADVIKDALGRVGPFVEARYARDYGVPGMKKGVRKEETNPYPHSASTHTNLAAHYEKRAAAFRGNNLHGAAAPYAQAARKHKVAASAITKRQSNARQLSNHAHAFGQANRL